MGPLALLSSALPCPASACWLSRPPLAALQNTCTHGPCPASQASDTCTRHTFPTLPGVARSVGALPLTDTQSGAALRCVQTHLHAHLCFLHKHLHRHMCLPGCVAPHSLGRWGPRGQPSQEMRCPAWGVACCIPFAHRLQVTSDQSHPPKGEDYPFDPQIPLLSHLSGGSTPSRVIRPGSSQPSSFGALTFGGAARRVEVGEIK